VLKIEHNESGSSGAAITCRRSGNRLKECQFTIRTYETGKRKSNGII
jgi:hypothetical protein